ncbi:di-and tricarboxylate transporter [Lacticaseibacillus zeae DSM 20178 = KCTC 3804]|jgi:Na+/H+ antiporter NhaD/arsenite permease-like protein|uniref:Cation transporter n=2 Tax=Lacticaseibacillus zeae TaxID=57037 RepID=A0A5R8LW48_LACZE|nr:SLC13 family permease [Lacticaseibacillus zeae]KRK13108.1 di-and tricarboxylate transporter [Lacticaseibacillus zeae DSM 20178 = KCTC 3804]OLS06822.1 cation transporter [Lacticaseibacillus casei]QVI31938.1 cation transporter [Lacticaseibacillus zeae]TLF41494.1 cation transporter [Lacticaseibacillus zeae]
MIVIRRLIRDRVLQITGLLVVISLFIGRPKISDISFATLWSILAMMTVIQIFEHLHILDYWAYRLTSRANNTRQLTWWFIFLAIFASMFLSNDVTVLTLVPLYLRVAKKYQLPEILPVTLIGMAANFGSAFTPFGNTHNIFLMHQFQINLKEFFSWSIPLLACSFLVLVLLSLFLRNVPVPNVPTEHIHIQIRPTIFAVIVACVVFAGVIGIVPAWVGAVLAILLSVALDPKDMKDVDYAVVLTFAGFFVIVSVVGQIPWVTHFIASLENSEDSVYLSGVLTSQVISNVPSTVLLARFTGYVEALFYGSNIGGVGTLVGSMANLLVFKQYLIYGSRPHARFFVGFTIFNLVALVILGCAGYWLTVR